jgi:predicted DNA-binding transcriptional regulator AlpA
MKGEQYRADSDQLAMPRSSDLSVPKSLASFDQLPDAAHVDVRTVAGLFGCSVPTVWRRIKEGKLPVPRKIGALTRWNVGVLRAALKATVATE